MADNKILKLDNENVKLYVTTNKQLPKLLKNSGSLIVVHENNDDTEDSSTNYLYLGNELIAGGWGLNTESQKDKILEILGKYDNDLIDIYNIINGEISSRDEEDQNIYNRLAGYVSKNSDIGGIQTNENNLYFDDEHFNSSFYNINTLTGLGKRFYVKNLLSLFDAAHYKDVEIDNITQKCHVGFFNKYNQFTEYPYIFKNDTYYVPYYSILEKYEINIDYQKNDTSGIANAYISRYVSTSNLNNDNIQLYKHILKNDSNNEFLTNNENESKTNFHIQWNSIYSSNISNENYLLFDNEHKEYDIFKSFNVVVGETPINAYKKFPLLDDFEMYSTTNIIQEHQINIDTYKIKPAFLCYYNNAINGNTISNIFDFTNFDNNVMIIDDKISFTIDFNNALNHLMSFAMPSKYVIKDVNLVKRNIKYNITGLFKSINNVGISLNPYTYTESYIKIPYNVYYMYSNMDYLSGECTIEITYIEDISTDSYSIQVDNVTNSTPLYNLFKDNTSILRNDEFDGSHWSNGYPSIFIDWLINPNVENKTDCDEMYLKKVLELVK